MTLNSKKLAALKSPASASLHAPAKTKPPGLIALLGQRADTVMNYLHKGDRITVAGSAKVRIYEKKDGSEGKSLS